MTGKFIVWFIAIVTLAPQPREAGPAGAPEPPAGASAQSPPDVDEPTTADGLLRELQRRRPVNELIPPASADGQEFPRPEPKILPEGWTVVDVAGRLSRDGSWWTFLAESARFERPIKLLPNASLEVMVRTATNAPTDVPFVIAGEVSVYAAENYLLIRDVRRAHVPEQPDDQAPPTTGEPVAPDAPVEDVLAVLKASKPDTPLLNTEAQKPGSLWPGSFAYTPGLMPDGALMASRAGRLVRQDDWWVFVFESDHPDRRDAPIKLLPNLVTGTMAAATEHEGVGVVYVVSGEVTQFAGQNYLLPRFATRRLDMGNLRP